MPGLNKRSIKAPTFNGKHLVMNATTESGPQPENTLNEEQAEPNLHEVLPSNLVPMLVLCILGSLLFASWIFPHLFH